jgi:sugar/nucleoside kinase (ribokinase family)
LDRLPRFDITVADELNLDLILYGLPEDLPTEREFLADGLSVTMGSSLAIFAHNLAVLGSRVGFISRVGDDPLGQIALDRLAASGEDLSKTRKVSGSTKTGLTVILPLRLIPLERETALTQGSCINKSEEGAWQRAWLWAT